MPSGPAPTAMGGVIEMLAVKRYVSGIAAGSAVGRPRLAVARDSNRTEREYMAL